MEHPLTGGCNCGAVRYEVSKPLVRASYCHCKRCQRRSGSGSFRARKSCASGRRRTAARSGSAGSAGRRCSAPIPRTPSQSGSAWGHSTRIRVSVRRCGSLSPTRRRGSRFPTTGCHAFPKAGTPQAGDRADKPITFPERRVFPEGLGASRLTGEVPRDSNIDPGAMVSEDLAPRKDFKRESQA